MMIALLLTALMAGVLLLATLMRRRSPAVALAMALVAALGTWFAWRPEDLNHLAQFVGVGRGADLALYLGLSLVFLALAALYLQLRHLQGRFTQLAREMALAQARLQAPPEQVAKQPGASALPVGTAAPGGRSNHGMHPVGALPMTPRDKP